MKAAYIFLILAVLLLVGVSLLGQGSSDDRSTVNDGNNVSMQGNKQIIDISAKSGYAPLISTAKAETPSVLRLNTNNTFDCSSAVVIPSLNYRTYLPPSGVTEVEIPPQPKGTKLQGLCAMGMYSFEVSFN